MKVNVEQSQILLLLLVGVALAGCNPSASDRFGEDLATIEWNLAAAAIQSGPATDSPAEIQHEYMASDRRHALIYLPGRQFFHAGEKDKAVTYWRRNLDCRDLNEPFGLLAGAEITKLGMIPRPDNDSLDKQERVSD